MSAPKIAEAASLASWRVHADEALRASAGTALSFGGRHWLALVNGLLTVLVLVATLGIVVLHLLGADRLAADVFSSYHLICAQVPGHSYHVCGQQIGLCQRCLAIYTSLLIGGLLFPAVRGRLRPIGLAGYLVLCLPMAIDGFTQHWGWWESDWILRTLTGTLFGLGSFCYLYPAVERWQAHRRLAWVRPEARLPG